MKLNRKRDLHKCGIYQIRNVKNNKVYIGKSVNLYERLKQHITSLNRGVLSQENSHFITAWKKYGKASFEYSILEYIDKDMNDYEKTLAELELIYIKTFDSTNPDKGYNIRYDSKTNTKVNNLTRLKQSENLKIRWLNNRETMINIIKKNWLNMSEETNNSMRMQLSQSKTKYYFLQLDKNKNLIRQWNTMLEILRANPSYKRHNIYAVCSGEKPSIYNYIWVKIRKEDIVQL